jgi:UPF0755 protein
VNVCIHFLNLSFFAKKISVAKKKKKSISGGRKFLIAFGSIVLLSILIISFNFGLKIYAPSVSVNPKEPYLYIPTGSNYNHLLAIIQKRHLVHSIENFDWVARQMNLQKNVHAGKYRIENRMSNYALAKLLRSGIQEPVKLVLNKFRLKTELAGFVSHKLEADSLTLIAALDDSIYLRRFDLTPGGAIALFIPNTYEFLWDTSPEQFLERMKREYDIFWNEARKQEALLQKLTPVEVIILASIVEEETNYNPEKPLIASVYLNRLSRGMNLQADPTVKFAMRNFSLRRVRQTHLNYNSDYNTYQHAGLPPGPICTPSIASIDAVLHAEHNDYLYFCADPDKPGTHAFAKTYEEHRLNAKRYQRWLDQQLGK